MAQEDPVSRYLAYKASRATQEPDPVARYLAYRDSRAAPAAVAEHEPPVRVLPYLAEGATDLAVGMATGTGAFATDLLARVTDLGNLLTPGQPLAGAGTRLRTMRDETLEAGAEIAGQETFAGSGQRFDEGDPGGLYVAGNLGTMLGSEGLTYVAGGQLLRGGAAAAGARGTGPFARAMAALGRRSGTGAVGQVAEAGKDALSVLPLDLASSIRAENSTAFMLNQLPEMLGKTDEDVPPALRPVMTLAEKAAEMEGAPGIAARTAFESTIGTVLDLGVRAVARVGHGGMRRYRDLKGSLSERAAIDPVAAELGGAKAGEANAAQLTPEQELEVQGILAQQAPEAPAVRVEGPEELRLATEEIAAEDAMDLAEFEEIIHEQPKVEEPRTTAELDAEEKLKARTTTLGEIDAVLDSLEDGLRKERLAATRRAIAGGADPSLHAERLESYGIDPERVAAAGVIQAPKLEVAPGIRAGAGAGAGLAGEDPEEHARNAILGATALVGGPPALRALRRMNNAGHLVTLAAEALPKTTIRAGAVQLEPRVARIVRETKNQKMPGSNWEQLLFNADGSTKGFKAVEDEWYGLRDFLRSREGSVTKDDILAHIQANQPTINVYTFGSVGQYSATEVVNNTRQVGMPRWEQYTGDPTRKLSGNNYREIVLSLQDNKLSKVPFVHGPHTGEIDNPLVWLRLNERQDANGEWVLYVEEIQSDMDQMARKYQKMQPENAGLEPTPVRKRPPGWIGAEATKGRPVFDAFWADTHPFAPVSTPDFPWEGRTTELAARYLIAEARRSGINKISWTPGALQSERYKAEVPEHMRSQVNMGGVERHYDEGLGRALSQVLNKELGANGKYTLHSGMGIMQLERFPHQVLELHGVTDSSKSFELFSHGAVGGALAGGAVGATLDVEDENKGVAILGGVLIGGGVGKLIDKLGVTGRSISDKDRTILAGDPNYVKTLEKSAGGRQLFSSLQLTVRERVGEAAQTIKEGIVPFARKLRAEVTRQEAPIEQLGESVAHSLAQGRGHSAAAEVMLENDLAKIIDEHKDVLLSVQALAIADRGLELANLGKKTDPQTIRQWIATRDGLSKIPEVAAGVRELQGYYRKLLDMKHSAGVLSNESYSRIISKGDKYIPFLPEDLVDEVTKGGTTYRPNDSPGVRKMTQHLNEAVIEDPFVQAIRDTYETYRRVARHNVGVAVNDMYDLDPAMFDDILEKLPSAPDATRRNKEEYVDVLIGNDRRWYRIKDPMLARAWGSYTKALGDDVFLPTINKMRHFMQRGVTLTPVFQVRNGIRDFFMSAAQYPLAGGGRTLAGAMATGAGIGAAVDEEDRVRGALLGSAVGASPQTAIHTAKHVARTSDALLSILGPDATGMLFGGMMGYIGSDDDDGYTEKLLKSGAGAMLGYAGGRGIEAVSKFLPTTGIGGELKSFVNRDKALMDEFLSNGGGQFGIFATLNRDADKMYSRLLSLGVDADDVFHPQSLDHMLAMVTSPLRTIIDAVEEIGGAIETAPRLARYKYELESGMDIGTAIFRARDQGLDFATRGSNGAVRALTSVTPFLNPTLIGIDKLVRMAGDKNTWPVAIGMMAAPTAALWMLTHMDEDLREQYQDRPVWERSNYWLVPKKWLPWVESEDRGFIRVAKPFELGFMGATVVERSLDALYDVDPALAALTASDAMGKGLGDALLEIGSGYLSSTVSPAMLGPMPFGPMLQAKMGDHGYDAFTQRPINPYPWRNVEARDQATPYTSTIARVAQDIPGVGEVLASFGFDTPAKIDFAIRAYTGTLGAQLAEVSTDAARHFGIDSSAPPPERGDVFSRAFVTREGTVSAREAALRQRYDEAEEVHNSYQMLVNAGNVTELQARLKEPAFMEGIQRYMILRPYMNMVDGLTRTRRVIRDSQFIEPEQKDQSITEINQAISGMATRAGGALARINQRIEE